MRYFRNSVVLLFLAVLSVKAGSFVDSLFRTPVSVTGIIATDSLRLGVRSTILARIVNVLRPSQANSRLRSPDVVAAGANSFSFFWADSDRTTAHTFDKLCRREIGITPTGVDTSLAPVTMSTTVKPPSNYLHADKGPTRYCATFIDKNLDTLKGFGDLPLYGRDTIDGSGGITRSTMCAWKNDTFLVAFQHDDGHLLLRRLYFVNNFVTEAAGRDTVTVAPEIPPAWNHSISNPSMATDNAGNFVIQWLLGVVGFGRTSKLMVFNASRQKTDSATFTSPVDTPGMSNLYDDAPLTSYGIGQFASVCWDNQGILFRNILVGPPLDTHTTIRLSSSSSSRYPSISSNGRYIAAVWLTDSLAGGTNIKISGIRDTIKPGYIPFSSMANELHFSDVWTPSIKNPGATVQASAFALNCAIDSSGDVAASWPVDSVVMARMWADRDVRVDSGTWISNAVKFMGDQQDSVCLLPGTVASNNEIFVPPGNDTFKTWVRVCWDTTNQTTWGPWTVVDDSNALVANAKGVNRFLQYKFVLYRGLDTLATPVLKKCSLRWNAKPVIAPLDSFRVNGKRAAGFGFGGIDTCFSRSDAITAFFTMHDADAVDTLYASARGYYPLRDSQFTLADAAHRYDSVAFGPIGRSDTSITIVVSGRDKPGWNAASQSFSIHTRNSIPQVRVIALVDTNKDGKIDSVPITASRWLYISETDSIDFVYAAQDTNDPGFRCVVRVDGARTDSSVQTVNAHFVFRGSKGRAMGDTVTFSLGDPDTTVVRMVSVRTNHAPALQSVLNGVKTLHNGDTLAVAIGVPLLLSVNCHDTDVAYWDKLTYRFTYASKDTSLSTAVYSFVPSRPDSIFHIHVTDSFGASDSARLFLKSPWLSVDTGANKAYTLAKNYLRDSLDIIVGSGKIDTVAIPLTNTGNDTLRITSMTFRGSKAEWFRVAVPYQKGATVYDSLRPGTFDTLVIAPGQTALVRTIVSVGGLSGDGVAHDTLIYATSDGTHPADSIPVNFEYNQLPVIAAISFDFQLNKPYWLSKKTATAAKAYVFPPAAKIAVRFSEPMDTSSAQNALRAYSVFDSIKAGSAPPIGFTRTWRSNDSVLELSPVYSAPSAYFGGLKPTPGFFIPGDSIRLFVSSQLTDQAKTPHGPNNLDVARNFVKTANADTMIPLRVDSVKYTITTVTPKSGDTGISSAAPISLAFSSPPLAGSIDTRLVGNRCLWVRSAYGGTTLVNFKSITVADTVVTFVPVKRFFFGDTVFCHYRAAWGAQDSLGYPVDISGNGIPMTLFDSTSSEDDFAWKFAIRNIMHTGVTPQAGAMGVGTKTVITVTLSDTVPLSGIDTSRRNNATLVLTSRLGGAAQVAFDSVKVARNVLAYYPTRRFFYGDSVFCLYKGLATADSAHYNVSLTPSMLAISTNDRAQWSFTVHDIRLSALDPDSGAASPIVPRITLTFSQPIFPGTFDTDTAGLNRSFGLTSSFTSDTQLAFKDIVVSSDSTKVMLRPKALFFSNDSVHCLFKGFTRSFRYDIAANFPPLDSSQSFAKRQWYFLTKNVGFYTFPNPYKPGLDPRHCSNPATDPCGIWFTNLHSLRPGITDVVVKIVGSNANPVYNSQEAGVAIHFSPNNANLKPMWKWDTRNQRGAFVASGLYFYVITDLKGAILTKGKLIIVR